MTKINYLIDIIKQNPTATNQEITDISKGRITPNIASIYIKRLTERGKVTVEDADGKRVLTVHGEATEDVTEKQLIYQSMIDRFLVDFDEAGSYRERLDIARVILKLLQRV